MKIAIKFMAAVLVFIFYYVIFCAIEGMDFGDPWDKLMEWVKKDKKSQ